MILGGGRGVGSMSSSGSDPTRKPGDAEFPVGLRVLVVDDDPTCLKILERMLVTCRYEVTKCNRVEYALNELRSNKNGFDVVISDVHMPNMDGFKLLEYVGLEMDLPVIMMSADDSKNVVMKGVKHGACDYLTKPVRMDALKNIWQHVVRKKKNEWQEHEPLDRGQKHDTNEHNWKSSKRKGDDEEADEKDDYANFKKQRVVWSVELHQQFMAAVNHLGIDKAVPKKILELMDVPGLTRENVASHLQKYRLCLRKLIGEPHHFGGMNNSFMGPPNPGFGGIDLQTLNGYQPTLARLPINPGISMPAHQTNSFGFETPNFRLSELQQLSNTNKQSFLLHENPTAMEPTRLTRFCQSAESLGSLSVHTIPQGSQSNSSLMQMILPQPLLSTGALVGVLPRNGSADNNQRMLYTSLSQPSPMVDLSVNHVPDITGLIPEGASLDNKRPRKFDPNYDLLNDLSQQKPQDWQTGSSSFVGIQHRSSLENMTASREGLINGNKTVFSAGPVVQQGGNIQSGNNLAVDNVSSSVKPAETVQEASSASNHYHFEFDQDDLLSAMLKQQEEDIRPVEGEFNFDVDDLL